QVVQVVFNDLYDKLVLDLKVFCLNQQALPEIPCGNASRIQVLNSAEDFFNLARICPAHLNDLFNRGIQIPVSVKIAEYARADLLLLIREVGKSDLPD